MNPYLVDTNILVRFFTGDPPRMAAKARALIAQADAGACTLVIPPIILAETFFTLESYYEFPRRDIASMLLEFVGCRGIEALEQARIARALVFCRDQNAHFADAYLASTALELGHPIFSFDHDFNRFVGVTRIEPAD
jgi:predicted nucleic acid-binding protein